MQCLVDLAASSLSPDTCHLLAFLGAAWLASPLVALVWAALDNAPDPWKRRWK
jgi:hypothetical protein